MLHEKQGRGTGQPCTGMAGMVGDLRRRDETDENGFSFLCIVCFVFKRSVRSGSGVGGVLECLLCMFASWYSSNSQ